METNTKVLTTCNGKGMSNGLCDTCFQPLQTTSIYCGRLIEVVAPSEEVKLQGEDGTNVIKILAELNKGIAERSGMKRLIIYEFQAKQIEDTFRILNAMQSWEMIKNVLSGNIDTHVKRF